MSRRPVAWVTVIVLLAEAVGFVFVNGVLATVVHNQRMSLAGLDADVMSVSTWVMGGVLGLCLLVCAGIVLRTAAKDRAPGRAGRIALIGCAILHGVLGALAVGLVGWTAFGFLMVVLALIVLVLMGSDPEVRDRDAVLGQQPAQQGQ